MIKYDIYDLNITGAACTDECLKVKDYLEEFLYLVNALLASNLAICI